jgi:cytosine/adenosine deaminase-related metal-dependent hydrolase
MLKYGVPVGLAVDGSASNDCSNLMAEIRAAYLMHRLNFGCNAPTGYDLLKIATRGSASILGRNDIGSLEIGKAADLFMIDTSILELVGAQGDPGSLFGTVGYSRPAKMVMVNGQVVAENGILTKVDEPTIRERAKCLAHDLLNAAGMA